MLRRLFFLFPDEAHAQRAVDQLVLRDIPLRRIHAMSKNVTLKTLPPATQRQKDDTAFFIERVLWSANLTLFAIALVELVFSFVASEFMWAVISFLIMASTFIAGEQFVVHVPTVHLTEFTGALSHGEILLMIDVPFKRLVEIEDYVHHTYPEAVVGGVSWSVEAFGI